MSHVTRKMLLDCNGEILEAVHNVPLLAVNGHLTESSMKKFNKMQVRWAGEYLRWKKDEVDFDS